MGTPSRINPNADRVGTGFWNTGTVIRKIEVSIMKIGIIIQTYVYRGIKMERL